MDRNSGFALCVIAGLATLPLTAPAAASDKPLRVCAAADGMPFSNMKGEGFENRIAKLVADDLDRPLAYVWLPDAAANPLAGIVGGSCDVVIGVPDGFGGMVTTQPYYWSSYVLISRADRRLGISSLKDHRLRGLKIGVASIGGDDLLSPPARVLSQIGLGKDLVAYPIDGGGDGDPGAGKIVGAVANGAVDIAAIWGPSSGYWVRRAGVPLTVTAIGDTDEFSSRKTHFELLGLQYEIAMGVRQGDDALRAALDRAIDRDRMRIDAVLEEYDVPLIAPARLSVATPGASAE